MKTHGNDDDLRSIVSLLPLSRPQLRAQALLLLRQGKTVPEVAQILDVTRQTIYNWGHRFSGDGDVELQLNLADAARSGRPQISDGAIDFYIASVIDEEPSNFGYFATTWTAGLLQSYLEQAYDLAVSEATVRRAIARLGLRWKRTRYVLSRQDPHWHQAKGG